MLNKHPALPYIAPFAAFLAFLALERYLPYDATILYPIRVVVVLAILLYVSRSAIDLRARSAAGSIALGILVFAIWVGPDVLWPGYRGHWLFTNAVLGELPKPASAAIKSSLLFISFRVFGCVLLVPVLEELFWRGWLARWLIDGHDFRRVKLGAYTPLSFWIGTALFASEHGPYWDVGLIAGAAYNWWMIRTKSLGDCILAHAVTNGCLSAYVLITDQWQYWM